MSRVAACSIALALSSLLFGGLAAADRIAEPAAGAPHFAIAPSEMEVPLDREALRARLLENRAANLARFRAYQKAGVFPSNLTDRTRNVWRDAAGHLCAAATIIRASGELALVDRVAEQDNFIRLADVEQGPLMDWILTSGLTQEEIVAIQRPFMPVAKPHIRVVDPDRRTAETKRLAKLYAEVDAMIAKDGKRSIELALDRLAQHRDLAWKLVESRPASGARS